MWIYEKRLIYPIKIAQPNPRLAKLIAMLLGGPAGELSASMTYLNQRYCMPNETVRAILTDVGTEELAHVEMLQSMMMQLLKGASKEALRAANMDGWVAEFGENSFLANWNGESWTAAYVGSTGDPVADLTHNMGAEQRARAGYEGVMRQCDDPDAMGALQFLREREIVHYQRFGEALEKVYDSMGRKRCF